MTPNEKRLLDYLREYVAARDMAPTYNEICRALAINSKSHVCRMAVSLERQGLVTYQRRTQRGLAPVPEGTMTEAQKDAIANRIIDGAIEALQDRRRKGLTWRMVELRPIIIKALS
jgi:SOS-response transcriptional repressor LexA